MIFNVSAFSVNAISLTYTPNRSASMPGIILAGIPRALMIARRYWEILVFTPCVLAYS